MIEHKNDMISISPALTVFKIGDKVTLNNRYDRYGIVEKYKGKVFMVESEPFDICGTQVIKLKDVSGGMVNNYYVFAADRLEKVGDSCG